MSPEEMLHARTIAAHEEAFRRQAAAAAFGLGSLETRHWLFIAAAIFFTACVFFYFTSGERARIEAEMVEFRAYMRECIPAMSEKRCKEIYRWTIGDWK